MKIEEIKSGKAFSSEQVNPEENKPIGNSDEQAGTDTSITTSQPSAYKVTFIERKSSYNWSSWLPKSTGVRRLLLVLAIIVNIIFVFSFSEECRRFGDYLLVIFLVFLGELAFYIAAVWIYRGFKNEKK